MGTAGADHRETRPSHTSVKMPNLVDLEKDDRTNGTSLCGRDGRTICGPLCVPKSRPTYVTLAHKRKQKFFYFGCSLVRRFYCKKKVNKNNNGTDGQTDRQTDRQSATQYAAPPREEGRITDMQNCWVCIRWTLLLTQNLLWLYFCSRSNKLLTTCDRFNEQSSLLCIPGDVVSKNGVVQQSVGSCRQNRHVGSPFKRTHLSLVMSPRFAVGICDC